MDRGRPPGPRWGLEEGKVGSGIGVPRAAGGSEIAHRGPGRCLRDHTGLLDLPQDLSSLSVSSVSFMEIPVVT
ncbi:unnamed protein product [Coccothraustes coccothraustes]